MTFPGAMGGEGSRSSSPLPKALAEAAAGGGSAVKSDQKKKMRRMRDWEEGGVSRSDDEDDEEEEEEEEEEALNHWPAGRYTGAKATTWAAVSSVGLCKS